MTELLRVLAPVAVGVLVASCGSSPDTASHCQYRPPTSQAWTVGSRHVQPCGTRAGYLDADAAYWMRVDGKRLEEPSPLPDCLRAGDVAFTPSPTYSIEYGANRQRGNVPLVVVDRSGHPLAGQNLASRPTPYGNTGNAFAVDCSDGAPGTIKAGGWYFIPAAGHSLPADRAPDCRRYAFL